MESFLDLFTWVSYHHVGWVGVLVFLAILILPEILVKPNVLDTTLKRGDGKSNREEKTGTREDDEI